MLKSYPSKVAEIQGPYGPLQVLENTIQKVWALQHLQPGEWKTRTGERLSIKSPGRWNRSAGPDFKEAVMELDGRTIVGDVEIHLYREDWWRHGHAVDPAYNEVALHVVLFAGGLDQPVLTQRGSLPQEWEIGPWIREDVEAISGGSPGLFGELVPELIEWMESDTGSRICERLLVGADRRWQDKVSMARCLHDDHGWTGALHRLTLYYLGHPSNRRAFFLMAETIPLPGWSAKGIVDEVRNRWGPSIRWGCGRPANRPLRRLKEYAALVAASPGWTEELKQVPAGLLAKLVRELHHGFLPLDSGGFRRSVQLATWENWLSTRVLNHHFNPNLIRRLWVDVYLPLLAATGKLDNEGAMMLWFHSHAAAFPESYRNLLRAAFLREDQCLTLCNGWIQGILWLEDQMRIERVRSAIGWNSDRSAGSDA